MKGLTPKERELLTFIATEIARWGVSPSYDKMRIALGLKSKSGIHRLVVALERRGHIERLSNHARSINVVQPESTTLRTLILDELPAIKVAMPALAGRIERILRLSSRDRWAA